MCLWVSARVSAFPSNMCMYAYLRCHLECVWLCVGAFMLCLFFAFTCVFLHVCAHVDASAFMCVCAGDAFFSVCARQPFVSLVSQRQLRAVVKSLKTSAPRRSKSQTETFFMTCHSHVPFFFKSSYPEVQSKSKELGLFSECIEKTRSSLLVMYSAQGLCLLKQT